MAQLQSHYRSKKARTNLYYFSLETGFFAGFIWGGLRWFSYVFHFSTVLPGFLLEPFYKHPFLVSTAGQLAGWLSFIAFSIVATLIYVLLFRKAKGPWPGIAYGVVWWALLFIALNPFFHFTFSAKMLSSNTNITEFCVFLLWGLFIGYTTAEEYTDEKKREPEGVLS